MHRDARALISLHFPCNLLHCSSSPSQSHGPYSDPGPMKSRITLSAVANLSAGDTLHDAELTGFSVRRQGKAAVYSVRGMLKGQKLRITIGKHGALTPHLARKEAQRLLGLMAGGLDPRIGKTTAFSWGCCTIRTQPLYVGGSVWSALDAFSF